MLWVGSSRGLSCFDGKIFRHYPVMEYLHTKAVLSIAIDKSGKLWLGTDRGIGCFDRENFKLYSIYSTKNGLVDNYISALLFDSSGCLWIGTKKGLNCLKKGKLTTFTIQDGLSHNTVTSIMEDDNHNIWISTWNGVNLFSKEKIINYSTKNGLPDNFIYSISRDREGNAWFATYGGASCLTSLNVMTYTKEDGLPNNMISDIIRDKQGRYWFAATQGLSCLDRGNLKNFTTKDGLISNTINKLMEDRQGNIWIATPQGLSIYSAGVFTNYTKKDGLFYNILFDLVESHDGTTWIGCRGGLIRCRNRQFFAPPFKLEQVNIFYIMEDTRGQLWFSSRNRLYNYSGNQLTSFSSQDGLPDNDIYTLFEDSKGKIWIGTGNGLSCFDRGNFTHYPAKNSTMTDKACNFILEDRQGCLWIGNSRGLACFDGKTFKTYTSRRLGLEDRSWLAGTADNSGRLWFGSTEGVTTFFPPPVNLNKIPPPVYFTSVKVMEKEVPLRENNRFAFHQNIFRFNFVGISFNSPAGVKYKYRMENIDKNWQITNDHSLFYPFLPSGSYTLKVKAINADGFESRKPAEYRFDIGSPFWKTWWFIFLLVLSVCSFLVLSVTWKMKRDREKAELKARNQQLVMSQRMELMGALAAGTVHDLKNLLAIIIGYSRVMSKKFHNGDENYQNIEIIKNTAATAVQMAKQILSFARHKNHPHEPVELGMLMTEILDTLKVTQPRNVELVWEPNAEPILFSIHPARFQQLVMNLCVNAFEAMSYGGRLKISLYTDCNNMILLEVSDTGETGIPEENLKKIFDPMFTTKKNSKGTGLGLFVVKQIVDDYKGIIEVRSIPGKETSFIIRFPSNLTPENPAAE